MRILIVFNQPAPYKVNLFNELNKLIPIEVIFERMYASNRDYKFYSLNNYEFEHKFIKTGYIGNENSISFEIIKTIRKKHYDLIIMNGYATISEMLTITYLKLKKIPYVLFINGGIVKDESDVKYAIKKSFISKAKYYLSPCAKADEYLCYYGANKEKIFHYPNSTIFNHQILDRPLTKLEKQELRKQLNLPIYSQIFVSPCQFIERKNNIQLLKSFLNTDKILLLIGSGVQKPLYENFIKQNQMNNVIILDYKDAFELIPYYRASDCFITLSKEDIYGHTLNEAMSQGLPAISSNRAISTWHLLKNGINGYIVDIKKQETIDYAISNISDNMAQAAIDTAKQNTIEEAAIKIHQAILEMIKK